MQTCQPGPGSIANLLNQIISFIFALTIYVIDYDGFDDNAMVTDRIITTRSFRQL